MEVNIENLMKTAIMEMENGQHSEASKHFDMVVISDSSNIDAPFFRAYCNCYDIKLGEIPNAAISFTNAFCRYVDSVKALCNPALEKEKLDYAVALLTQLVSMFQVNAKNEMWIAPSLSMKISRVATAMNDDCRNKLNRVAGNVSYEVMKNNEAGNKSNKTTGYIIAALIAIGIILYILWMIPWYMY